MCLALFINIYHYFMNPFGVYHLELWNGGKEVSVVLNGKMSNSVVAMCILPRCIYCISSNFFVLPIFRHLKKSCNFLLILWRISLFSNPSSFAVMVLHCDITSLFFVFVCKPFAMDEELASRVRVAFALSSWQPSWYKHRIQRFNSPICLSNVIRSPTLGTL